MGRFNDGTFHGRQAIEKSYATRFQRWRPNNYTDTVDRLIPVGNDVRSIGRWSEVFQDADGHVKNDEGHYSSVLVREGDTWKIRRDAASESNPHATN
jgi:ketosteroid isomerase-like protein